MREGFVRTMEAFVAIAATYMAAVTMVQTTLYNKILTKISNSVIGPMLEPYMPYFNIAVIVVVLFVCFTFWRRGDEVWFGRLFSLNMLMFFPSVLDFSTFNWIGLIFDLTPVPGVTHIWVFAVGLLLQITYLMLRYTVRFRYVREELRGRGSDDQDINDITRGQVSYLVLLTTITAGLTAGIYFAIPYFTRLAINPLAGLPAPHMLIGFLVVVFIAAATVMYLRSSSED
jgi:hypothetical protein